jgi:hypothetical protein
VFTARGPESADDFRQYYYLEVMELALQKTLKSHGAYQLRVLPIGQNIKRALLSAKSGQYENYFVRQSVSYELLQEMAAVPFPLDLGITGYRVAFTSEKIKQELMQIKTLAQLNQFSIIQGLGWMDTDILQANGFVVETGSSYKGMFHMVANNHLDLFTRGVNEFYQEWKSHQYIKKLTFDESIALYYPLPRFFFTAQKNRSATQRLYKGLVIAYHDGSLIKIWQKFYAQSVAFAQLENRLIFTLENPFIQDIDKSYEQFIYQPTLD